MFLRHMENRKNILENQEFDYSSSYKIYTAICSGLVLGLFANFIYSGIESYFYEQNLIESFYNFSPSLKKAAITGIAVRGVVSHYQNHKLE